jgi:hypothetical protein
LIIRHTGSSFALITQPQHAALGARIVAAWDSAHLPDTPRRASIFLAIEHHDRGWAEVDERLLLDAASGRVLDFMHVSDEVKRTTSTGGIDALAADPYAAALVAQHRLHVYRRYASNPDWLAFFADVTHSRDGHLAAAAEPLDTLLRDYAFLRAGDLASLAFCNGWTHTDADGCGYEFDLSDGVLAITPDPLDGREVPIAVEARVIDHDVFDSTADARRTVAAAAVVPLVGVVVGRAR